MKEMERNEDGRRGNRADVRRRSQARTIGALAQDTVKPRSAAALTSTRNVEPAEIGRAHV